MKEIDFLLILQLVDQVVDRVEDSTATWVRVGVVVKQQAWMVTINIPATEQVNPTKVRIIPIETLMVMDLEEIPTLLTIIKPAWLLEVVGSKDPS